MAKNLKRLRKALEKESKVEAAKCEFFPTTFELPSDYHIFVEEFKRLPGTIWIMKPAGKAQGKGTFILKISMHGIKLHTGSPDSCIANTKFVITSKNFLEIKVTCLIIMQEYFCFGGSKTSPTGRKKTIFVEMRRRVRRSPQRHMWCKGMVIADTNIPIHLCIYA